MLIPSEPVEQCNCFDGITPQATFKQSSSCAVTQQSVSATTVTSPEPLKKSLDDFYKDWRKDLEDRKKETNTVKTLCETLTQGLYQQSPHVVFKVIGEIRTDMVQEEALEKLSFSLI